MKKIFTLTVLSLFVMAAFAFAGDGHNHSDKGMDKASMMAQKGMTKETTVEGKLVCLACTLKEKEGATGSCKMNGCSHVIQTSDGHYIGLLKNKFALDLISGEKYHNKDVKVTGVFHASANVIDVEKFEVEGKKKAWCDHCKAMDGCSMAKK